MHVAAICKLMVANDNTSSAHNRQLSPFAPGNATQAISAKFRETFKRNLFIRCPYGAAPGDDGSVSAHGWRPGLGPVLTWAAAPVTLVAPTVLSWAAKAEQAVAPVTLVASIWLG